MCRRYLGYNKTSSFYYPDARFNSHYRQIRSNRSGSFFKTSTSSYYVPVNDIHEKYIYTISRDGAARFQLLVLDVLSLWLSLFSVTDSSTNPDTNLQYFLF